MSVQPSERVSGPRHKVYLTPEVFTVNRPLENPSMNRAETILARARQFDPRSLADIHDELYPIVYRYVRYRLDDEQVCEDITSEVFLRLLKALRQKSGPTENLRGWMLGTASHLVNDYLRGKYRHKIDSLDDREPTSEHTPEEAAEYSWQRREVRHALLRLTPEQQHVLALRFSHDHSLEETAEVMGKSVGAVKTLQFRALAALRRLLEERSKI